MGFDWNLSGDAEPDTEPEAEPATDNGSTGFAALGLDFRSEPEPVATATRGATATPGATATRDVVETPAAPVAQHWSFDHGTGEPTAYAAAAASTLDGPRSSAETSGLLSRRALREAERAASAGSLGEIVAEPVHPPQEAAEPVHAQEPAEPVHAQEPAESSPFVFAAAEAASHPAAANRRSAAAGRPKGRVKNARGSKPVTAAPPTKKKHHHLLSKLMTVGAMLGVAGLMVSTSLPANAFYSADFLGTSTVEAGPAQTLEVKDDVVPAVAARDGYTVASLAEQMRLKYGSRAYAYTNNPLGTIQWPFPIPVPIASGYGDRYVPNCAYCSTFHQGVDFTPGAGAPIQAIADGVVIGVNSTAGGLGQHVVIEHTINGQKIQSWYAHMLTGSIRMTMGQVVKVGDQVGQVGSTGTSTGAHLHLEIHVEGVPVDPFVWLKANAN
ncbi:hypothetical protein BH09ACT3_BH09ACT3_04680 [soil metagenome]